MATINDYFLKYGTEGFRKLAAKAGTSVGYLQQLNYSTKKRPSISMAEKLIEASNGELTFEGLANPRKILVSERDQMVQNVLAQSSERRNKAAHAEG